jgi:chromosomal replication initiation ATPase DnaA
MASQKFSRKTTLEHVLLKVCQEYDIGLDELSSGSRQKRISEPRSVAALLVRDIDHISLMQLSLGLKRDLSGLSQAASRLDKRMKKDRELTERIGTIKETIMQYPFVKPDPVTFAKSTPIVTAIRAVFFSIVYLPFYLG